MPSSVVMFIGEAPDPGLFFATQPYSGCFLLSTRLCKSPVIWDNASWHLSRKLRACLRAYQQIAKHRRDVRLLVFYLLSKSPWLNPIEPRWVHAKRQTLEPSS